MRNYGGRPTPLYFAQRLTERCGGAKIYLKREDLCHGGAHKFNNVMGQALLCKRMGKSRVIAETGAGQHGTATAMAAAVLGLKAEIYMGTEDIARQEMNVFRMKLMGAKVHPVDTGSRTLKDALNEAFRDWAATVENTYYMLGTAAGPHPYPAMVRDFQSVIGRETRRQLMAQEGKLPDLLVACVGGGSNAIGTFHPFLKDEGVAFLGAEAAGKGIETGRHSASISGGRVGVLHGCKSYLLQDGDGMISETHSVAAGLDYPGVGPEHSLLNDIGRAEYTGVTDDEALYAFRTLSEVEGIIPALESSPRSVRGHEAGGGDGQERGGGHHRLRPGGQGPGHGHRPLGGAVMSRLRAALSGGRKLVCFVTAGYPSPELSAAHALACVDGGADVLELGVPFSDPVADGRVIQYASQKSLENGMTPRKVFDVAAAIRRRTDVPIVLMGYYNPIFQIGEGQYARLAAESGTDGLIVPDLPCEESLPLGQRLSRGRARPGAAGRTHYFRGPHAADRCRQLRLPVRGQRPRHHWDQGRTRERRRRYRPPGQARRRGPARGGRLRRVPAGAR